MTLNFFFFFLQFVLSQDSSKPLRQTLEAHSLKLVNSTFSIPQVRRMNILAENRYILTIINGGTGYETLP